MQVTKCKQKLNNFLCPHTPIKSVLLDTLICCELKKFVTLHL